MPHRNATLVFSNINNDLTCQKQETASFTPQLTLSFQCVKDNFYLSICRISKIILDVCAVQYHIAGAETVVIYPLCNARPGRFLPRLGPFQIFCERPLFYSAARLPVAGASELVARKSANTFSSLSLNSSNPLVLTRCFSSIYNERFISTCITFTLFSGLP